MTITVGLNNHRALAQHTARQQFLPPPSGLSLGLTKKRFFLRADFDYNTMEVGAISQFEEQFVSPAVMKAHLKVRLQPN
jgi:hypothetical protein